MSAFHLSQNRGTGLLIQGSREWRNYSVDSVITANPAKAFGLAARVQGLTRYYALMLGPSQVLRLVRNYDSITVLAEIPFVWNWAQPYHFVLQVSGTAIVGSIDGRELIRCLDDKLLDGGIALICEEGLITTDEVRLVGVP